MLGDSDEEERVDGNYVTVKQGTDTRVIVISLQKGGSRGTVVAHWTVGQQVERSILHLGHSYQNLNH